MKTLAELLASGTMAEIAEVMKANTERFQNLATKSANTQDELAEMTRLDDETEQLQAKYADLKKIEDAKARNADRVKAFKTPVNRPPFGNGGDDDPGNARKAYTPAYSSIASLKHINVGTRQENEELAYRFFKFFAAVCLPFDSGLRAASRTYCEENGIPVTKAVSEGRNEEGGALVPAEFDPILIRPIERYGLFRGFTRMTPMASETKMQPRRTGGVQAFWVGEGKQITASNPTFDNVNLVAKKLAAISVMSSEITEDAAVNIADELAFEIGYAMALSEDQAGFLGDGTSAFGSIFGIVPKLRGLDAAIANIAGLFQSNPGAGTGADYGILALSDFNNTVALLPQYADTPNAGWYCHRSFYYGVMQRLELAAGGNSVTEIANGDRRPRPLFLGYPVNFTQVMPRIAATNQIPVVLGDLAMGSMMGDRRVRTLFTDPYSLSNFDQIQVRGTERIDINVFDLGNASATPALRQPGSIVGLVTKAT
ncbi:MAG TPA: phage major capsid protein [Blastocatellia bacterium]|nr:phage major capsid protein [Blastocatellia bacterium]